MEGACPCIITVYMCSCIFATYDLYQSSRRTGEISPKLPFPSCQVSAWREEQEEEGGGLGSFFPGIKATWGTVRLLVIGSHPLSAIAMLRRCLECHTTHPASLTSRKQAGVWCVVCPPRCASPGTHQPVADNNPPLLEVPKQIPASSPRSKMGDADIWDSFSVAGQVI